jgi:ubiquitin-like 1-activating enzyme E1 B
MSNDTALPFGQNHSLSGIATTLGADLMVKIVTSKILVVGAGGIGCELLKNLALSGFRHVEVIDLDTIDVSNLNRQFLFRSHHVGSPKCEVAVQAALSMCPSVIDDEANDREGKPVYIAHHGNVKDSERFGLSFFQTFDVVLNALDNVDARRHVNRLCLASNVPLVEAGTTGYLGQVTVIAKDANVECYECQPKPAQKVYPICTIRSTPSLPVHTIVWAKELFKLLFHEKPELSMLYEDSSLDNNTAAASDQENGTSSSSQHAHASESVYMEKVVDQKPKFLEEGQPSVETLRNYAFDVLHSLYNLEIQKQLAMDRYKTAKKKPDPISVEMIQMGCLQGSPPTQHEHYKPTDIWTPIQCISEFVSCIVDAYQQPSHCYPNGEFDKDDPLAMRFVTAASNLRSHQFGIDMQSYYETKGIAGNIIPAIATTNAIVAGLQLLQVFQILKTKLVEPKKESRGALIKEYCRYIYCLRDKTRKGYYLQPTTLADPNPKCFVCRNAQVDISIDTETWTLQEFVNQLVKKRLGFSEPTILIGDSQIYEEGENSQVEFFSVNLPKTLVNLPCGGIKVRIKAM